MSARTMPLPLSPTCAMPWLASSSGIPGNGGSNRGSTRTEEEIRRDRKILGCGFRRWMMLLAALLIQLTTGTIYAWSVFNQPVDGYIYGNIHEGRAALASSILICFSGVGSLAMGPLLDRRGPRLVLGVSAFCFALGQLVTALGIYVRQMGLVYVGYSVLGGYGIGGCYIVPVSMLQKWYPDRRGFASGFAVAGLGIGAIVCAEIAEPLLELCGVPLTFVAFAVLFSVLLSVAVYIVRTPPPDYAPLVGGHTHATAMGGTEAAMPTKIEYTIIDTLLSREYRLLYWLFIAGSAFCGRILFAWLSDTIGRKTTFVGVFAVQIACIALETVFLQHRSLWPYLVSNWAVTACFGGILSLTPPTLAELFGIENISTGFSILFVGWSMSGTLCGVTFTAIYNRLLDTKRYTASDPAVYAINYLWLLAICCTGMIALCFVRMTVHDRLFPPVPGQWLCMRVGARLLRISTCRGVELLSPEAQATEWKAYWRTQPVPPSGCVPASTVKQLAHSINRSDNMSDA
ncbi:major facilitator superfamily domain-containing protein [Syncephalis pseudoplumigaleata]|uniref:Major facilitator superfamily domain-containing protein n=1 Tax=Syncephalis pseudoplumigaleata TaxID=1712513 RepID=A0A4P9Z7C2_9FUNG|nr:major facilitator superfamily domain-containing protein [Syncephalis pseudoplumigaleata]|eukprot:RKP27791.1 major facilitator superfamily domain-containing protein [Syncephalis pseudoplumigaleata]